MKKLILLCATLMLANSQANAAADAEAGAIQDPKTGFRQLVMRTMDDITKATDEVKAKVTAGEASELAECINPEDTPAMIEILANQTGRSAATYKNMAALLSQAVKGYVDAARGHLDEEGEDALTQLSEKLKALKLGDEAEEEAAEAEGAAAEGTTKAEAEDKE